LSEIAQQQFGGVGGVAAMRPMTVFSSKKRLDFEQLEPAKEWFRGVLGSMKIAEAARECGLSTHTIRYYEKSGMLPEIERGADGHRRFNPRDVNWLTLLYWLRETGMSLKQMQRFTTLAKASEMGVAERRQILLDHAEALKIRRAGLEKCESVLAFKIASYDDLAREVEE